MTKKILAGIFALMLTVSACATNESVRGSPTVESAPTSQTEASASRLSSEQSEPASPSPTSEPSSAQSAADEPTDEPTDEPMSSSAPSPAPETQGTTAPETQSTDGQGGSDAESTACPAVSLPDGHQVADVAFDGDGDGEDDVLAVYQSDGQWWLGVQWASGGGGVLALDDITDMGARALGGHDLDGDGVDEAFVAISGPASGSIIAIYHRADCGLAPVIDGIQGGQFTFPVTATAGNFTSAVCADAPHLALFAAEFVADPDDAEQMVWAYKAIPYTYDPDAGALNGSAGADTKYLTMDEASDVTGLQCGALIDAL